MGQRDSTPRYWLLIWYRRVRQTGCLDAIELGWVNMQVTLQWFLGGEAGEAYEPEEVVEVTEGG